jgi:hypothetical protein
MSWHGSLALAVAVVVATPGVAASADISLEAFLAKKYGKTDRFTAVFNKVFPRQGPTMTPVPFEGRKPDGSYWWGAYFRGSNVVVLSWPHKTLEKQCAAVGGTLMRAIPYSLSTGPADRSVWLQDASPDGDMVVTPQMIGGWAANDVTSTVAQNAASPAIIGASPNAMLVDARGILGIFTCGAGGSNRPLWHVGMLAFCRRRWGTGVGLGRARVPTTAG